MTTRQELMDQIEEALDLLDDGFNDGFPGADAEALTKAATGLQRAAYRLGLAEEPPEPLERNPNMVRVEATDLMRSLAKAHGLPVKSMVGRAFAALAREERKKARMERFMRDGGKVPLILQD